MKLVLILSTIVFFKYHRQAQVLERLTTYRQATEIILSSEVLVATRFPPD